MDKTEKKQHPGEALLCEINKRGMKQKELALRTGVSEKHISTVINGTKDLSASFARKLDIALGDVIGSWAKKQAEYDAYMAELEEQNGITDEERSILKNLKEVVNHFLKNGVMHNHCGEVEKVLQLRKILCVNNLRVIPKISYNAAYRAQINASTNIDPYVLFAWQRMCEIKTEESKITADFNADKLLQLLPEFKKRMFTDNAEVMIEGLKELFSQCGVAFEVVPHFRGAPVQGFIKLTSEERIILCLTIRGKKADRFWFSLFHEIGHLVNGDLNSRFVDFDSVKSEMEDKADAFARDTLISSTRYKSFVASGKFHLLSEIEKFSTSIGVPRWITIGRLQKDEWLDWSDFADHIPSFEWVKD